MTTIINGKELGLAIRSKLGQEVNSLKEKGVHPGLAVVLVGENPASKIYVRNKQKACEKIGINSFEYKLATDSPQSSLESLIHQLNRDKNIHGILVQLPLPNHIDTQAIIEAINPAKDVDGFHPENMGKLLIGLPCLKPCTPLGILEMLDSIKYDLRGKQTVVIGRSTIVGKPLSLMLLEKHATVTICHSRTQKLPELVRQADLVVAAIGKPRFVQGDWIKKEAVVIDVGINRMEDGSLVGDVDFETAKEKAAAITPVPKGVGPMTIALLLKNTLQAARDQNL